MHTTYPKSTAKKFFLRNTISHATMRQFIQTSESNLNEIRIKIASYYFRNFAMLQWVRAYRKCAQPSIWLGSIDFLAFSNGAAKVMTFHHVTLLSNAWLLEKLERAKSKGNNIWDSVSWFPLVRSNAGVITDVHHIEDRFIKKDAHSDVQ